MRTQAELTDVAAQTRRRLVASVNDRPNAVRLRVARPTAFVAIASVLVLLPMGAVWGSFDDGISASAGIFIGHGLFPYRDIWLLYGPLSGLLVAALTVSFGPSLLALHCLGLATAAGQAAAGYVLVRRKDRPTVAAVFALAATVIPMTFFSVNPGSWQLAMFLATAALAVATSRSAPTKTVICSGILAGLAGVARQDVGIYALIGIVIVTRDWRAVLAFGAVTLPVAVAVLAVAPWDSIYQQLIWYPLVGPRIFRAVVVDMSMGGDVATTLVFLPVQVVPRLIIAMVAVWSIFRRSIGPAEGGLLAFAALCQLQTLGRGDIAHFAQASTPAYLLAGMYVSKMERPTLRVVGLALGAIVVGLGMSIGMARGMSTDSAASRLEEAARYVSAQTSHDDPIFVGLTANSVTTANPLLAYFIADRRPATRFTMYNPGVTDTDAVQAQMVGEIEVSGARYLLLGPSPEAVDRGSSVLDRYITSAFDVARRFGEFVVMVRR